jgi:LPXTG-motif cell wall-anchored protein
MRNKIRGPLGRLAAWGSAAILVTATIAFAAPSYAAPNPGQGQSAPGQAHTHANHQQVAPTRRHAAANAAPGHQGGSAVSLGRPNDFQAQADPDGMENGGVDQPGGQGGIDTTSQDGNNGSGNDADCEDDNNGVGVPGHCKDRPGHVTPPGGPDNPGTDNPDNPGTDNSDTPGTDTPVPGGDVAGPVVQPVAGSAVQVDAPGVFAASAAPTRATAAPAAGVLPNTGAGQALLALALAGIAGLGLGAAMLRQSRRTARITS